MQHIWTGGGERQMAKTALNQLQDQIEAIGREAYAQGYAAAMQAIRDFAGKPAPSAATAAAAPAAAGASRRGRRPAVRTAAAVTASAAPATPVVRRRGRAAAATTTAPAAPRAKRTPRPQRGTNARFVEEVLQTNAPRALRPAEIRTAIQREKGVAVAFTSISHALGQLVARQAAEQVGDSKTWRSTGSAAAAAS